MSEHLDSEDAWSRDDWWRMAAVGVLAVVLSLIGLSVSSRFQPSGDANTISADVEESSTTSSTTSTTSVTLTTSPTEQTTTTVAVTEPATLTLSQELLDFGADDETIEFQVAHTDGGPSGWTLSTDSPYLSIDPAEGDIEAGASITITVSLDRSQIGEGDFEWALTLSWPDGEASATVAAVSEDNPIIHNPEASPGAVQVDAGSQCSPTMTTISARVRDTSEVDQVIARWSPDGSATRETAMSPVGDDLYEGVIGPFTVARNDSVKVVAFDVRGNAGGASISVTVAACE